MLPISTPQSRNVVDALSAYGVGNSRPTPVVPDGSRAGRRDDGYGSYGSSSSSVNVGDVVRIAVCVRARYSLLPELVRAPNPYNEIPSLYDMYVQAIPKPTTPKRFGSEVFENGTRDSQLIPMDLPAGPDYVVGPGDGLSIDLWGGVSSRIYRVVDREGRVSLPEVGPVLVSGKSLADVQQTLAADTANTVPDGVRRCFAGANCGRFGCTKWAMSRTRARTTSVHFRRR